jgi:phosphatidylglycerophosphate synthase
MPPGSGASYEQMTELERSRPPFLTAANLLTLSRLPLAALVWFAPARPAFVLSVMALAGLTDVLDGALERRRRARQGEPAGPGAGVWLDPLCDKVFVVSTLVAIAVAFRPPLYLLPLIAAREILQALAAAASRLVPPLRDRLRFRFRAAILGKATTVVQFFTIAAILYGHPLRAPLAAATAALGVSAALLYVGRAWQAGRKGAP